jgi:hypothetical protein
MNKKKHKKHKEVEEEGKRSKIENENTDLLWFDDFYFYFSSFIFMVTQNCIIN